jgi:hypothetical protein
VTAARRSRSGGAPGASGGARAAIVVGLAVILGIVGLQILDDSGDGSSDATVTTVPGVTTTGTDGTATTTTPVRNNKDVRVKVYNASGVPGRAQTLTDTLGEKHYDMQDPANLADKRQGIAVECVAGFEREAQLLASYGVGGGATAQPYPSDPPDGASDADCIVVIGTA